LKVIPMASILPFTPAAVRPAPADRSHGLLAVLTGWLRRSRTERELRHLDARLLRDIGIERHELLDLTGPAPRTGRLPHL
jgi:uncharacterized protein YjiS (DUF1127 family)